MGRCGMEQQGHPELRALFMELGPLPGQGWGQEEGAAGVPGEVTLFPHICVQRPLIATHMQTLTSAHANTFTQTHMCIHIYTHTHMCNALTHRHAHLQVHKLAHAQPFRAIFDIPLPQGRMSTRVLMSSAGSNFSSPSGPVPNPDLNSPTSQEAEAYSPTMQEPRKGMAEHPPLFSPPRWSPVEKWEGGWGCQGSPDPFCVVFNNWPSVEKPWCSVC